MDVMNLIRLSFSALTSGVEAPCILELYADLDRIFVDHCPFEAEKRLPLVTNSAIKMFYDKEEAKKHGSHLILAKLILS